MSCRFDVRIMRSLPLLLDSVPWHVSLLLSVVFLGGVDAPAHARNRTCAVLPDDTLGSAHEAFLDRFEVHLHQLDGLTLLNRTEIQRILSEHVRVKALQNGNRQGFRECGQVLRADFLVRLSLIESDEGQAIHMLIIETGLGVRVAEEHFPWPGETEALTALMAGRVAEVLGMIMDGVRHIVAIPPFRTDDFTYEFGPLKQVYAEILSNEIGRIPGVAVVEFSEAATIARELALSQGLPLVQRSGPVYVEGWYQNRGRDAQRRVDIRIDIRQGDERIETVHREDLSPEDVPAAMKSLTGRLAKIVSKSSVSNIGNRRIEESHILTERVSALRQIGDWPELAIVGETCLLIDPDRTRVHLRVAEAYGHMAADFQNCPEPPPSDEKDEINPRFSKLAKRQLALSGLSHLRSYFAHYAPTRGDVLALMRFYTNTQMNISWPCKLTRDESRAHYERRSELLENATTWEERKAIKQAYNEQNDLTESGWKWAASPDVARLHQRVLDKKLSLITRLASREDHEDPRFFLGQIAIHKYCVLEPRGSDSFETFYERAEILLLSIDHFSNAVWAQYQLLSLYQPDWVGRINRKLGQKESGTPEYDHLLTRLENRTETSVAVAARIMHRIRNAGTGPSAEASLAKIEEWLQTADIEESERRSFVGEVTRSLGLVPGEQTGVDLTSDSFLIGDVRFDRLDIQIPEQFQFDFTTRWGACCKEHDCIAQVFRAYSVNSHGQMRLLCDGRHDGRRRIADVIVDEHRAWVLFIGENEHLRVYDLGTTELLATFGVADGLLPTSKGGALALIAPGRVLCIGAFGRSWIGELALREDEDGSFTKHVDVFFEARNLVRHGDVDSNPAIPVEAAFRPKAVMIFGGQTDTQDRAVIWRSLHWYTPRSPTPLVVNLSDRQVRPMKSNWARWGHVAQMGGRGFHFGHWSGTSLGWSSPPDFEVETIPETDMSKYLGYGPWHNVVVGDKIHYVGDYWISIEPSTGRVIRAVPLPKRFRHGQIIHSEIFGLVYFGNYGYHKAEHGPWRVSIGGNAQRSDAASNP